MSIRNFSSDNRSEIGGKGDHTPPKDGVNKDTFHFWNGDEYTGMFSLFRDKQKIVRQGEGVYKTGDYEIYEGIWENDILTENCKITFFEETVFTGGLKDMQYQGSAKFIYKNGMQIETEFIENQIIGRPLLKDANNNLWKGTITKDGNSVTFRPVHPYWQSLLNMTPGNAQVFYEESAEENEGAWDSFY